MIKVGLFFIRLRDTVFFFICIVTFSGCVSGLVKYYNNLNNLIIAEDFDGASSLVEKSKYKTYGEKNALLYYLDKGLFLHLTGKYEESNIAFEKAKSIAEEYFTKSITTEATTLLVSDNVRPYYGEDFERALIHVFSALNYIFLDNEPAALVEARQVDHFLKTLQTNYGYKSVYKEDAFVRYLMGMIYENQGDINNAYISYINSLNAYENYRDIYKVSPPSALVIDSIRTAKKLGFRNEITEIEKKWKVPSEIIETPASYGELVLLHYNGISPVKIDSIFEISFGKAWIYVGNYQFRDEEEQQAEQAASIARNILAEDQVRIAFPKYVSIPYRIKSVTADIELLSEQRKVEAVGFLVQNIGAIAEKSLDARINRVRGRAIARAAIKYSLANKAGAEVTRQSKDEVLGWLTKKALSTVAALTEQADKRSWRSLPDEILMIKIYLPEDTYNISLNFKDEQGNIIEKKTINKTIISGKKTFAVIRTGL